MAACVASDGHPCSRTDGLERRMLLVVLAAAALLTGCFGGGDRDTRKLLDGSLAGEAVELEGVDGDVVVTSHVVVSTTSLDPGAKAATCLRERFAELEVEETAVVRTGVSTESVTFLEERGTAVFGCSNTPGPREQGRWCGGAYGELSSGRLTDPRLSIACKTRDRVPVGFVWVQPSTATRFIAVEQPEYTEVYEVAGELPVRIATVSGVDTETSSASFEISEHDEEGMRLGDQTLEAFVAG